MEKICEKEKKILLEKTAQINEFLNKEIEKEEKENNECDEIFKKNIE